ncbi:MAG: hypothetical protein QME77_04845 [bacterium]|nr:hypothetical protein [bacterium]
MLANAVLLVNSLMVSLAVGLLGWTLSLRFLPPIVVVIPWVIIVRALQFCGTHQVLILLLTDQRSPWR